MDPCHWPKALSGAAYELGRCLGLFRGTQFPRVEGVFWTDNRLGNGLHDALLALVDAGVLERRDQPDEQFRWSPSMISPA